MVTVEFKHIATLKGGKGDPGGPGPSGATGTKGAQGDQGLPGTNAVENDTAFATYMATPTSETWAALQDALAAQNDFRFRVAAGNAVEDNINEWWITPQAMSGEDSGGRFVFRGSVGAHDPSLEPYGGDTASPVYATEWRPGTPVRRVMVGRINTDDHNVPAVMALPSRRRVMIWSGHNIDNVMHVVTSDRAGSLDSMAGGSGARQEFTRDGLVSYAQIFFDEGRSTASLSYYWIFQRRTRGNSTTGTRDGWGVTEFTVNENVDRGGVTLISSSTNPGHGQRYFFRTEQTLSYLIGHQKDGKIQFLAGQHPTGNGKLARLTVDMATGEVTGAATGNIFYTPADPNDAQIWQEDFIWEVEGFEDAGKRRRFFYLTPGGYSWALWDWPGGQDVATYKYTDFVPVTHLQTTGTGYALGTYRAGMNSAASIGLEWYGRLPSSVSADTELIRRYEGSSNGSWYVRVTSAGRLVVGYRNEATGVTGTSQSDVIPGLLGSDIGIRFELVGAEAGTGKVRFWYTTDDGATWISSVVNSPASFAISASTSPIRIGFGTGNRVTFTTRRVRVYVPGGGTDIARATFVNWPFNIDQAAEIYTDPVAQEWKLFSGATIGTGKNVHSLGIAGPRIGHDSGANYIPGAASLANADGTTKVVVTVHRDVAAGESYINVWKKNNSGNFIAQELFRTKDVLARPYLMETGPIGLFVARINRYDSFRDFEADLLAFGPL